MLFDLYELKSRYELEYELGDYDANLNILSKEIFNITSKLYSLYIEKEVVRFHYKANNNRNVYVDFQNVSENTWFRSEAEIKEILYRPKVKGQFQKQFSINKGQMCIRDRLLRYEIAKNRGFGDELELAILAKMMLAEYYTPDFYKSLPNHLDSEGKWNEVPEILSDVKTSDNFHSHPDLWS